MKLIKLMTAAVHGLCRQACCACIERCTLIAGAGACSGALVSGFLDQPPRRRAT